MRRTNVCIAAVAGSRAIRLDSPTPNEEVLSRLSDLKPGDVIDVEWSPASPLRRPHVEDSVWNVNSISKVGRVEPQKFVEWLQGLAFKSVPRAFGEVYITGTGGNCAFKPDEGRRSLAAIEARDVSVYLDFDKIRVEFTDASTTWRKVALEDQIVHRHRDSCAACRRSLERILSKEFDCSQAILRIGLSRPFSIPDHPTACWLQVNGIYPLDRPRKHFV